MAKRERDTDLHILLTIVIMSFVNFKVASLFLMLLIIYYLVRLFNIGINLKKINIAKGIEVYKSNSLLSWMYEVNTLIKENIAMISFISILTLFLICLWQFNIMPSKVMDSINKEAHATFGSKETYVVNKTVYFDDIGVGVSLISISKTDYGALLELTISNKSNLAIKPALFDFNVSDNEHGKIYDIPIENYDVIRDGKEKTYIFNIEELPSNCNEVTLNIEYDDFIEYRFNDKIDIDLGK